MADQFVQISPDSTGKKIDTSELTVGTNTVERQRIVIADPTTAANLATVTAAGAIKVDGSAVTQPVSVTDLAFSGSITTQNLNATGAATANSAVATTALGGACAIGIQVTGTYTGALTPQVSNDGTNWSALSGIALFAAAAGSWSGTIASASTGCWQVNVAGYKYFRIVALAAVTGTATVTLEVSSGVTPYQSGVNIAQVNGASVVTATTGVQKVGIVGSGAATVDAAVVGNSSPTNALFTVTSPHAGVNGSLNMSSTAALTVANIKATVGNVYGLSIYNPNSSVIYLQFYNTASTPTLGTGVVNFLAVPATSVLTIPPGSMGIVHMATGIGIGASTTATSTGTPTTAPSVSIWFL